MRITVEYEQMKLIHTTPFDVESAPSLEGLQKLVYENVWKVYPQGSHGSEYWKYAVIKAKDVEITDDETLQKTFSEATTFKIFFRVHGHS